MDFKPKKEDREQRTRRERVWQVIQNFLRSALKGAYPDKETYSYFCEDEGTEMGFGGTCLKLQAVGVILVNRKRFRPIKASICANQCGVVFPNGLKNRLDYAWAYAEEKAKKGDTTRITRMLPNMTAAEQDDVRQSAGPIPQKASRPPGKQWPHQHQDQHHHHHHHHHHHLHLLDPTSKLRHNRSAILVLCAFDASSKTNPQTAHWICPSMVRAKHLLHVLISGLMSFLSSFGGGSDAFFGVVSLPRLFGVDPAP